MTSYNIVDQSNIIVNVIEWNGEAPYEPPPGTTLVAGNGPVGWHWQNGHAVDPDPSPPAKAQQGRATRRKQRPTDSPGTPLRKL